MDNYIVRKAGIDDVGSLHDLEEPRGLTMDYVKLLASEGKIADTPTRIRYWEMLQKGVSPQSAIQTLEEASARNEAKISERVIVGETEEYATQIVLENMAKRR